MKLYLNETSPFARLALVTAIESKHAEVALEWVDPWTDDPALLAVTPFAIIPVLETAEGTALYESLLICLHLGGAAAFPQTAAAHARLGYAKTLMELAFRKAIFNRFFGTDPLNPLAIRAEAAVTRALAQLDSHLEPLSPPQALPYVALPDLVLSDLVLPDLALAVALDYTSFRLSGLYEAHAGPRSREWLAPFLARPSFRLTTPEVLAARPANVAELTATLT